MTEQTSRFHPGTVVPLRALDQLDRLLQARIATIIAPAGYGKTALVRAWLERHPELDETTIMVVIRGGRAVNVDNLASPLAALVAEGHERVVVWVDNHHRIKDPDALHQILDLLQAYPQVRIILAGRTRPPIAIGALAMRGDLVTIGQADLALDETEAAEMLGGDVGEILIRYHGWPIALQLMASIGTGWRHESVVDDTVDGYIAEEILMDLAADDVRLLEDLSPAASFTPDLAMHLTGRADAAAQLTRLASVGVPIEWSEGGRASFNPAVRRHLLGRLEQDDPARLEQQNRRVGAWLQRQGRPDDAVRHALVSHDRALLAEILTDTAVRLIGSSPEAASEWLERISPEMPQTYVIGLLRTLIKSVAQPPSVGTSGLETLREAMPADATQDELAAFHAITLLVARPHNYSTSDALVQTSVGFARRVLTGEIAIKPLPLAALMMEYGQYCMAHGEAPVSQDAFELSVAMAQLVDLPWLGALSQSMLAFVHALTGSASTGERLADEVLLGGVRGVQVWVLEYAMLTKAMIALDRRQGREARVLLEELRAASGGPTPLIPGAEVFRLGLDSYIRVNEGDAATALVEIDTFCTEFAEDLTDYQCFMVANAAFTAALSLRDHSRAEHELGIIAALDLRPDLSVVRTIDAALLELERGETHSAYERLAPVIEAGNQSGNRKHWVTALTLFARAAAATGHTSSATAAQQRATALANRLGLLPPAPMTVAPLGDGSNHHVALTPAERQVLISLAGDAPLSEVAAELFISQNTLKTHLRRIYRKLGVAGRADAVALAREQSLF